MVYDLVSFSTAIFPYLNGNIEVILFVYMHGCDWYFGNSQTVPNSQFYCSMLAVTA